MGAVNTRPLRIVSITAGNKKIGIRSALLEEKALTCHMLCCFAAELKEMVHLWGRSKNLT
ncbi:hypothetical protein KY290_027029 [Solanum tuberosum]|uniref:Uncharacterized protein n=1 Tax=Solanum tuberosum TaxID=4113 RepID=A0ABQ7UDV9_SOLTU|nr:hypothetical protein KY284_028920 [Solanum tuberosum]KAH0747797.1 hypothetical protein KY290_027029 [Solanum tuberosum]